MNKLLGIICLLGIGTSAADALPVSLRATTRRRLTETVLIAKYDWQDGAKDVSGSPVRHDGVLDNGVTVEDGTLSVNTEYGVDLGIMPELDGALKALFKFDNVNFTDLPEHSQYSVLLGGGYEQWWVGVRFERQREPSDGLPASEPTFLIFNVGGWGARDRLNFDYDYKVKVSDERVSDFESIEYRFDGVDDTAERLAIRWNGGDWMVGGWTSEDFHPETNFDPDIFRSFPTSAENLQINDMARSDWDYMTGTMGPVSLYASRPTLYYNDYEGVCRMNADGTGTGSNGQEYDVYKQEDDPNVDYAWCKNKCTTTSSCTGFEYRDMSWNNQQCEIWYKPILGFEKKEYHHCLVKLDRNHCYDERSGVCRANASDDSDKGHDGVEYDLYKLKNYLWCKTKCSEDEKCTGIEHRSEPEDKQQCEIWHAEIRSIIHTPDSKCDMKVYRDHCYVQNLGVCRADRDGADKGNNGDEYDLYKFKHYWWCKAKCSAEDDCTGFEHRWWPEDDQQCEIWHNEIKSVVNKPYSKCDLKVHF